MALTTYRPLDSSESHLLEVATLGNLNWCGDRFTMSDLRSTPDFAHYTVLDPSRGDFGIVAIRDERPVGVAWTLFLPRESRGYGFVDEQTPEVSVWVNARLRGQGIGRGLMQEINRVAHDRELPALSLSVEGDNPARNLYVSEGYVQVPGREKDGVMLLRLQR